MTEPRTEAKLELADAIADQNLYHGRYGTARAGIAAAAAILAGLRERGWVLVPEAEAAATPAGLDVERLARAIARLDDATTPSDFERRYATDLAREYAALAPDPGAADPVQECGLATCTPERDAVIAAVLRRARWLVRIWASNSAITQHSALWEDIEALRFALAALDRAEHEHRWVDVRNDVAAKLTGEMCPECGATRP